MAVVVKEAVESRKYRKDRKGSTLERIFWVHGTDDPDVAQDANGIPRINDRYGSLEHLFCDALSVDVLKATGVEAEGLCKVSVIYKESTRETEQPPEGEVEFEISTLAQTEHVVRALGQANYPQTADVGTLIGVNGKDVEGVDIYVPKLSYREIHERDTLADGYLSTLIDCTAKVNENGWKGFEAGELIFMGATARRRGTGPWRVEYMFAAEKTVSVPIETVSGSQNVLKGGWDYLWFTQAKIASENDSIIQHKVQSAHVAQVYGRRNFTLLGIG